jgi:hypothetical protein
MSTKSKKFLKRIVYVFLILLLLIGIVGYIGVRKFNNALFKEKPNHLAYTAESKPIQFNWANDSIGNHFETKTAMLIPLKFEGFSHKFYVQFDTGSQYSYIYENDLKSLKSIGVTYKEVIKDDERYVQNLDLILGGNRINASMIKILENYGNTFTKKDTISRIKIATIGSDMMDNRITVIDFKNQYIRFYNERPEWMINLPKFQHFDYKGRRFMLPATINGKELELYYDSGSSAFGLITSKTRYDKFTNVATKEINYNANRWGDALPIRHKSTQRKITIGGSDLDLKRVSYVDMYANYQKFMSPFTRVGGWLGNLPFTESTLILDTKTEEFIVIKD